MDLAVSQLKRILAGAAMIGLQSGCGGSASNPEPPPDPPPAPLEPSVRGQFVPGDGVLPDGQQGSGSDGRAEGGSEQKAEGVAPTANQEETPAESPGTVRTPSPSE